jgi:hypothetical protein
MPQAQSTRTPSPPPEENSADFRQENQVAISILESFCTGDEQEQHDTLAFLKAALDEDRLSDRPRFA